MATSAPLNLPSLLPYDSHVTSTTSDSQTQPAKSAEGPSIPRPRGAQPDSLESTTSHIGASVTSTGTKRKRETDTKYYAVRNGHKPGIYYKWGECLAQVKGFKNAIFKSFSSLVDAETFLAGRDPSHDPQSPAFAAPKFYAVRSGRQPGIYNDWESAQKQIVGWTKPKYQAFTSQKDAEAFLKSGQSTRGAAPPSHSGNHQIAGSPTASTQSGPNPTKSRNNTSSSAKKQKDSDGNAASVSNENVPHHGLPVPEDSDIFEPGTGPLPPGAEDGFDPGIILIPHKGQVRHKTNEEKRKTTIKATGLKSCNTLRVHTDGSSLGNGRMAAVAGVGVYFGKDDQRNISEALAGSRQTNQRAELTAILRALDIAPRHREVIIVTDSSYAIKCVTEWCVNWRKNGWRSAAGKAVENRDLIEDILRKMEERDTLGVSTKFEWVKGHSTDQGNVEADRLAVAGARNAQR
ncbi:MAG: hypothetical protein M1833_002788 [Piccolia ochrophora]|nr:MAG: hypothetical protein M1833_002788 [Piccolia ochrophora]